MAAFYRELRYQAAGFQAHVRAWHRADDLPGVDVLSQDARKLGFLERSALFADDHACRLVLEVSTRATFPGVSNASPATHPYRRFQDFMTAVRPDIADLIGDLSAEHNEVTRAFFAFKAREYEPAVRKRFARELEEAARGRDVDVTTQVEASASEDEHVALFGRVRGDILGVLRVAALVRRSGLVDIQNVRLQFA